MEENWNDMVHPVLPLHPTHAAPIAPRLSDIWKMNVLVATENNTHARHLRRQALKWEKKFPFVHFRVVSVGDGVTGYQADMIINLVTYDPREERKMYWLQTIYGRATPHCVIMER